MTVAASTAKYVYTGDGTSVAFPFPALFLANNDLLVGVDGVLQLSGYTVSGAGNPSGGTVTFSTAPANGVTVVLLRKPAFQQLVDFVNGQTVLEGTIETALDRLTMMAQYLLDAISRSVRVGDLDTATSAEDLELPAANVRANQFLAFDADGNIGVAGTIADSTVIKASQAEAEAGTDNTKYMTPLRVSQRIDEVLAYVKPDVHLYTFLPAGTDPLTVTNWSPYLNAAAASGKFVELPDHALPFGSTITGFQRVGGGFIGKGYNTLLQPTFNGHYFQLGDDVDGFIGHVFAHFRIWPTVKQTGSNKAFRSIRGTQAVYHRVWLGSLEDYGADGHMIRTGFSFERIAEIVITGQSQIITETDGIQMHGGADGLFGAEILIDDRVRFLHCDAAIHIGGGCGGVYIGSVDVSLCGIGVNVTRGIVNIANREIFLGPETVLDVCSNFNLNVEGSAAFRVMLTGTWLASNSNSAAALIRSAPTVDALKPIIHMVGGRLFNAQGDATQLSGCKLILDGVEIADNGLAVGVGGHGINAVNAAVELYINGCHFRGTGNATKGYAVNAVAGVTGSIKNSDFDTSGQAHINNLSATLEVRGNRGWKTEARGQNQVAGLASSVTFAHGLNGTPLVQITPRTILGASAASYYRVTSDATNITVETNVALNATPWAFNWHAEVP